MAVVRRSRATPPPDPPGRSTRRPPPRVPGRTPERRIYLIGLLISAALHAALFLLSPSLARFREQPAADPPARAAAEAPPGMRVVELRPTLDAVTAPVVRDVAPPRPLQPPPTRPPEEGAPEGAERPIPSARDRITYRAGDPRIWRPVPQLEAPELLPGQILLERVRAALADSISPDAFDPNLDWTFTDAQGRRWGVSPGKLHLGDITIPLPAIFSPPPGRREEIERRLREWEQIQQQGAREAARASQQERARAMRERRDREREEQRP